jgi:hypothetical protein
VALSLPATQALPTVISLDPGDQWLSLHDLVLQASIFMMGEFPKPYFELPTPLMQFADARRGFYAHVIVSMGNGSS